ncbi:hypothetical protein AB9K24_04045 [Meridianimaribacter flavus]|jgi:hypothetical protein
MKKNQVIVALALILTSNLSIAQEVLSRSLSPSANGSSGLITTTPVVLNDDVEGTPYITSDFLPARISASDDNIFYVRYNAIKDEIEVKGDNNQAFALNKYRKDIIIKLVSNSKTYRLFDYVDDNELPNLGYFVDLIPESNIKLLKKERVIFIEEKVALTSYHTARPAQFKRVSDDYYIKISEEQGAVLMPKRKKDIAKLIPEHSKDILSYIKTNKIKTSREEDLIKLVSYMSTL